MASSGGPPIGSSSELTLDDYRAALDTCVLPLIATARAALPYVRRSPAGRLLFITSYVAKTPIPEFPLSASSRPAVLGFAKSLTYELQGTPTTVNVLAPGAFDTPAMDGLSDAAMAQHAAAATLGRVGRPEELGDLIGFLAGERASYITGSVITVDGGAGRSLFLVEAGDRSRYFEEFKVGKELTTTGRTISEAMVDAFASGVWRVRRYHHCETRSRCRARFRTDRPIYRCA